MTNEELIKIFAWGVENKEPAYEIKHKVGGIPNFTDYVKCGDLMAFLERLVENDKSRSQE